jgi:hypothetical protein
MGQLHHPSKADPGAPPKSLLTWYAQISPAIPPFAKKYNVLNGSSEFHPIAAGYLRMSLASAGRTVSI